jgi:hypothetical protein
MGVRGVFVRLAGRGRRIQPIGCAAAGATVVESSSWMGDEPASGLPGVGEEPVPVSGRSHRVASEVISREGHMLAS